MLDYLQAGEIRRKYPEHLNCQDIHSLECEKQTAINSLNNLTQRLESCKLVAADCYTNSIGLQFLKPDKTAGLVTGSEVKVLVERKYNE